MATSTPIQCPEQFSFISAEWPKWRRRFERYYSVSGLAAKTDEEQANTLVYLMGDKADDIVLSLSITTAEKKKYSKLMEAFEKYFIIRRNVIYERAKFKLRVQLEGESVDDFITSLHALVEHCAYQNLQDEMVRDRIVVGVRDRKLSEKLQLDNALTLKKAVDMTRNYESVRSQQDDLRSEKSSPNVDSVQKKTARARNERQRAQASGPKSSNHKEKSNPSDRKLESKPCPWCGGSNPHPRDKCPAKDQSCNKCDKPGHYALVCRGKKIIRAVNIDSHFIGTVQNSDSEDRPWTATISVAGVPINFKLDCGADVTCLPASLSSKFKHLVKSTTQVLRGPANMKLPTTGEMCVNLALNSMQLTETVYFVGNLTVPLLSRRSCKSMKLITCVNSVSTSQSSVHPEREFPKLFSGLGKLDMQHVIRLRDGARPVSVYVPRRVPIPLMGKLKTQLDEMVLMDVITPVDEPTEWCSPMVIVQKNNRKLRLCVDLTEVNKHVLREIHPMAAVDYSLGLLGGAKYKSKLDGSNAFWQIPLDEASQLLTTFITPFGRFCFRRLPYGISSAPEVFQKRMSQILSGISGVICHMDDILIGGATLQEHDERLRQVLQRLLDAGMTLNRSKCVFCVTKLNFLGHVIDEDVIRPDEGKVAAITKMLPPTNVSEVHRFLGLANYLGRFVPNFANVAAPLYDLLKAKTAFVWGPLQQTSFENLKTIVSSSPALVMFDEKKTTRVSTDASSYGLGAVLQQKQKDGALRPVAFASRTLSVAEKRYGQIEKEALAFTWAGL